MCFPFSLSVHLINAKSHKSLTGGLGRPPGGDFVAVSTEIERTGEPSVDFIVVIFVLSMPAGVFRDSTSSEKYC
jgi:hypothetical protein